MHTTVTAADQGYNIMLQGLYTAYTAKKFKGTRTWFSDNSGPDFSWSGTTFKSLDFFEKSGLHFMRLQGESGPEFLENQVRFPLNFGPFLLWQEYFETLLVSISYR